MIIFYVAYSDNTSEKIEAKDYRAIETKILATIKGKGGDVTIKDFWKEEKDEL